ncbi:MAG TPA: OmpH family outer membrane protein [Stellaceae bacterium]|nr:OmpH family outer membrane protein [Stellaceae bacterium]
MLQFQLFRWRWHGRAAALSATLLLASVAAWAQSEPAATPAPVIVMVDMQQLVYNSKAAKSVQAQMDKERESFSKQVAEQEDQLQRARADLERQRNAMAPDQLEAKSREFQQKLEELDRTVQARQRVWQEETKEAIEKVQGAALQVVAEIAAARHANLVIQKAAVVLGTDGFDITTDALTRLDQRLPSVTLEPPATEQQPASPVPPAAKN